MLTNPSFPYPVGRASRHRLAVAAGLFLVALFYYGRHLSLPDIYGDDEALDAGVVREMAEGGHWLFPFFNGAMVPEKPPLFFWLAGGVSLARGRVDEVSVRLPSVVLAAITVLMVFLAGRRQVGDGPALLAAIMLLSAPMMLSHGRTGRVDMTLTACATAVFFAAARALETGARRWHRTAFCWLAALPVLAKAGAGLGIVVFGVLALLILNRKSPQALMTAEGVLGFVVLGFGWHVLGWWMLGDQFVSVNLVQQNLAHFLGHPGTREARRTLGHFLRPSTALVGGFLPWPLLGAIAFHSWRPAWSAGAKIPFAWAAGGLLFFSLAGTQHSYYVLPIMPPLALCLGAVLWIRRPTATGPVMLRGAAASLLVATILVVVAYGGLRAWAAAGWVKMAPSDRVNAAMLWGWWSGQWLPTSALLLAVLTTMLVAMFAAWRRQGAGPLGACAVVFLLIQGGTLDLLGRAIDGRESLKTFGAAVARVEGPVYAYGDVIRQVVFHAHQHIRPVPPALLEAPDGEPFYLVARAADVPAVQAHLARPAETIGTGRGRVGNVGAEAVVLLRVVKEP